jgi:hypothetical protein
LLLLVAVSVEVIVVQRGWVELGRRVDVEVVALHTTETALLVLASQLRATMGEQVRDQLE